MRAFDHFLNQMRDLKAENETYKSRFLALGALMREIPARGDDSDELFRLRTRIQQWETGQK